MSVCYWNTDCPVCAEGRLFIVENLSRGLLYLHCEECEAGFEDPQNLKTGVSYLTLELDYECRFADPQTINKHNWQSFALHELDIVNAPKICPD